MPSMFLTSFAITSVTLFSIVSIAFYHYRRYLHDAIPVVVERIESID